MGGDRVWAWLEGRQKRVGTAYRKQHESHEIIGINILHFNTTLTPP